MRKFGEYVSERDNDVAPVDPGEEQLDPEKPDNDDELTKALKEIMQIAKRAIEKKDSGLGDKTSGDPEPESDNMSDVVSRPKSDTPEGLFGQ